MTDELFSYSDFHNIGFFINPDIQDSQFKAMKRREQLLQGAYYYANADRDDECRNKSAEIFGRGTIPLTDKENSAFFLGDAVLKESGYLGSPFEYWVANNKDLPPEVQTESDARIYIGNQIIDTARQQYDQRKEYEKKVDEVRDALPRYIAQTVRMPGVYMGQLADKQAASVLSDIGMWDKLEPSVQRARTAWIRSQHMLASVDAMQEAGREELADLADILSNEKGAIDEVAVEAYFAAVRELAMEKQSKDSQFWATFADSFQNFLSRTDDEQTKDAYLMAEDVLSDLAIDDIAMKQDLFNPEAAARRARLYSPKVGKMIGILQNAMDTAMEPSKEADVWATLATDLGKLSGDAVVPMIGAIAASAFTKGAGIGVIGQAAAGWAGGFAVSHDSIINQSVAQAYLEGVENPEEYGIYSGLGQSAAENIAGVGTSGFYAFKFINKGLAKAGAKFGTSRVLSNAYARATLAWAGTTVTEGTMELAEEELGSWMGAQLNALARANGVQMSEQKHEWGKTISQMPEHQIAAMYVFAGALGLGGGVANYTQAQQISMDVDKLKASGFSDKTAREVVADGIVHAQKVEEVKNSDLSEEKKDVELKKLSDERLAYLGKMFNKDVVMASNADMQKRSQEENAEFTYRAMLAMAIRNGLDEKAMEDLGLMAKREAGGKYLVSYEEPAEGENAKPKLVQKEWTRDQLTGFLLFQRGTAFHNHIREIQSALSAVKFAQSVASVDELGFKLANLKDIPLSEIEALRYHNTITPELFAAFAEHEAAKIATDMSAGMSRAQAEAQPSAILPGVSRGQVLGMEQKSKERIEQAKQTGEIKTGQNVYFPAINISRLDGSTLVAYFSGKVSLPKMLEEMFEGQLKQQARNNPDLYNQLGKALQNIQRKLGVKLLPKNKTEFSKDDIIEGYSHLAVAEMLSNAEYINLPTAEKAVVMDVLRNVETAAHYKLIADAWQTYKNSDEGKDYLGKGGKDIMDIMRDAGFTFGKHFSASQVSAEERAKLLEERDFMFDVEEEAKQLEEQANAEEELSNVNAKEAEEPVVIPASESVTGEEIVEQPEPNYTIEPTAEEQSPVQLAYQNIINGTAKVNDYALYLYYNPMSDAEATERGIRTLNQQGEESALYTQGKLLSVFKDGKYSHADGQARDVLTGEVPVNRITHSPEVPQFKTNKAGHKADEKGVVYSLPGDYRMHDPIHLWHRKDGSLVVISGRHRLQKAIEAGAEFIPATVFPEVTGRDAAWARMHDFEQNVLDNQASVADTALYVQGLNPKNRKLTEDETKQFTRKGSNSEYGSYIGLHGSQELVAYLSAGAILPDYAYQIAQIAPDNPAAQKVAIEVLVYGDKGIMEAKNAERIYLENQQLRGTELFQSLGGAERQEAFMRFLSAYAANKIRMLGRSKRPHSAAKSDKSIREHEAAGIKFEDAVNNRAKLNELTAEQEAWRNVGTHPELLEEAKAEFDKTDEGAQQYFDFGANFSVVGVNAKTWDKYVKEGRTFEGRDDGKMRAELDSSVAKIILNNFSLDKKYKIDDVLFFPELFEAYPQLASYTFEVKNFDDPGLLGQIYGKQIQVSEKLFANKTELLSTLLHELQHAIQGIEGFATGGSELSAGMLYSEAQTGKRLLDVGDEQKMLNFYNAAPDLAEMLKNYIKFLKIESEEFGGVIYRSYRTWDALTNIAFSFRSKFSAIIRRFTFSVHYPEFEATMQEMLDVMSESFTSGAPYREHVEKMEKLYNTYFNGKMLDSYAEKAKKLKNQINEKDEVFKRVTEHNKKIFKKLTDAFIISNYDYYKRLSGEIESRNVSKRMHMSAEERKQTSFNDTLEYEGEALLDFSIAALSPGDRFPGNPLAVRMSNYLRREAKRFARVLGDKTPHDTAVNAINSARSVIGMLDKYIHTNAIPISRDARNRLNLLQRIIEKYAQIIEKGSKRSFNQISKEEQGVLDAIVEEMGAALETGQTKETAKARYKELIRMAAKGRVWQLLSEMMTEAGNLVDIYLKNELLQKLKRVTNTVKLKRSKSGKLKGKMGAADYRRMDTVVQLMGMSARAKDNALGQIEGTRLLLQSRKNELPDPGVNELIDEIRNELKAQGKEATMEDVYMALNNREADLLTFADIESMDYDQTRKAANALATLIYAGRAEWELAQQEKYEKIKAFLDFFYKHTSALAGTAQENDKAKRGSIGNIFNSSMSDAQLLFALSGHEALRPVMDELRRNLATAQDARNLHLKAITNQIYATYARLIGMRPQTEAGYTDKQLREASNKLSLELEKWNKTDTPDIVRKWMKDGELLEQKMELTRLQALDLILTYRQPHYQINAATHGYTEEVLNKLEDFCGTRLMAMGAAFKYSIQNDGTAAVYEEREGIPMYNDPTYWPGSININTINITSEEPIVNPFNVAGSYHFLKERVKHTHEAKYQNAFEKWKYAISERANYIYLAPITGTLNRMLAHNEFANRLKSLIGADLFAQLRLMLNTVDGSTWQETSLRDEANNWAARMLRATAPAVLALNPQTYMRQLSAINNYAMMPNVDWNKLPAIITLIRQDKAKMTLGQIVQLDSFKARVRDNAALNDMIGLGANAKFSRFNQWAKAGMNHIDVIDVWSNAVSACLYYNMLYEQLEAKNKDMADPLSEEEIRKYCEQSVSEMLRLVAQPLEKANKSAMYWKAGNTWYGSLFMYMSSEMINKAGMLRATYLKNKAEGMSWAKNMSWLVGRMGLGLGGMTFLVEAAIFMLFAGDLPDDEKEWLTAGIALAVYSSFGQYFSRIPFVGSVVDYYLSPYGKYTTNKNVAQAPALNIDKTSAKLLKMLTDKKEYSGAEWQSAYTRFVRDLTAVAGLASGIKPEVQWISTTSAVLQSLSAAMNSVYPVSRAVQSDSWWRNVTPDGYSPKKTKKREKSSLEEGLDALFGVEKDKKKGKKKDRTSKKD